MHVLIHLADSAGLCLMVLLCLAGLLHLIPRLGAGGRHVSDALCRAPGLDVIITCFTTAPLIAGAVGAGWIGIAGAVIGQVGAVLVWVAIHEQFHREAVRGPRIVKVLNRLIGRWRNHAALWWMAPVAPILWLVRVIQIVFYPPLAWLAGLPRYRQGEWVNVSRQKFRGLVGHDLIWCLYCDWMTGVWSLGTEMLRNIESFWCPIRFASGKKCENCQLDFPDLDHGWVAADGTMSEVAGVLEQAHSNGTHAWFGHPVRITIAGRSLDSDSQLVRR